MIWKRGALVAVAILLVTAVPAQAGAGVQTPGAVDDTPTQTLEERLGPIGCHDSSVAGFNCHVTCVIKILDRCYYFI